MALATAAAITLLAAACTAPTPAPTTGHSAHSAHSGTTQSTPPGTLHSAHPTHHGTGGSSAAPPGPELATTPDLAAIKAAIDAINRTAGGPVAVQRVELQRLVTPSQGAQQRACPIARSTLAFQPAYHDLRTAPPSAEPAESTGTSGPSSPTPPGPSSNPPLATESAPSPAGAGSGAVATPGTGYLLPAFITIYTGDRITGTDLTTLRLWVSGGVARTGVLCVS